MAEVMDDIVRFVTQTRYDGLPDDIAAYAKKLCLSQLAGLVGGVNLPASQVVARHVKRAGGAGEAGVAGHGFKAPVAQAALCNATITHATEFEDGAFPDKTTIGPIIPAVFTLGHALKSSGEDVIASVVAGFDLQAKTSLASKAGNRGMQVFSSGGSWGCAASAANLMKLDAEKTHMTMAIAASQFGSLMRQTSSMTHFLESGFGARDGITSAQLAQDGCTGFADILETPGGFWDVVGGAREDLDTLRELLAGELRLMRLGIKKFACPCIEQRLIDGALHLRQMHNFHYDDVERIEVHVAPWFTKVINVIDPTTAEDARFSIHHVLAGVILGDAITLRTFTEATIDDPRYAAARRKVDLIVDESRTSTHATMLDEPDEIVLRMTNGQTLRKTCVRARGFPPEYLNDRDVANKFREAAEFSGYLKTPAVDRLCDMVLNLEKVGDVSEIMDLVTSKAPAPVRSPS